MHHLGCFLLDIHLNDAYAAGIARPIFVAAVLLRDAAAMILEIALKAKRPAASIIIILKLH